MAWNALIAISMVCMCSAVWLLLWRMSKLPKEISYELQKRDSEQENRVYRAQKRESEMAVEVYQLKKALADKLFEERQDRSNGSDSGQ